jgi:hypothetical protein
MLRTANVIFFAEDSALVAFAAAIAHFPMLPNPHTKPFLSQYRLLPWRSYPVQ